MMKTSLKLILSVAFALLLVLTAAPTAVKAATENPSGGIFIKDKDTDFFQMDGESQNGNVQASMAWRYGDYVYFALNCQKNVSVNTDEFKINGVVVGEDNYWLLGEGVPIKMYNGADDTAPGSFPAYTHGQPRIWIVGRILLSNSSLQLTFENLHNAGGWEIAGVTIEAALRVSHKYGTADPIMDFDQSAAAIAVGQAKAIHPVPKDGYVYDSVSVKFGTAEITDLASKGITKNDDGTISFTVTQEMVSANMVAIDYVYAAAHKLTVHYVFADGTEAAPDHSETLKEGASYSVTSPTVENYTPDQATVSGTMGTADVVVTVTYTATQYTLTIKYVYAEGGTAAEDHIEQLAKDAPYSVTSPTIENYTPDQATVSGTMPAQDVTVTVTYTQNSTETSSETQPTESSSETQPTETPTESQPETKQSESQPSTEPTETQPSEEPTETQPAETQPETQPSTEKQNTTPKTGDPSMIGMWLAFAAVSFSGVCILTKKRK